MATLRYSTGYYDSLRDFVASLQPKYGLEIGTEEGDSAHAFLTATTPWHGKLVCIDPQSVSYRRLQDEFHDRHIFIQGFSPEMLRVVKDRQFDYIYIDGDHSYEAVKADAEGAFPMLKKGGVIAFDDYTADSVQQAVNEFADKYKLDVKGIDRHPHGAVYLVK